MVSKHIPLSKHFANSIPKSVYSFCEARRCPKCLETLEWEIHCLDGLGPCVGKAEDGSLIDKRNSTKNIFPLFKAQSGHNECGERGVKYYIKGFWNRPNNCQFFQRHSIWKGITAPRSHVEFCLIPFLDKDFLVTAASPLRNPAEHSWYGLISNAFPNPPAEQHSHMQANRRPSQSILASKRGCIPT